MEDAIKAFDWTHSPVGPPATWPASLKTVIDLARETEFAMMVMWGPDLIQIYNDGYIPILGDKHPRSIGQPAEQCWADIWDEVGPLLRGVYERGEPVYAENLPLPMTRHGRIEQAYFTFSYSPIRDGGAIGGLICVVDETTVHVEREAELRASELRFRTLAASLPQIVFESDRHGRITFLNEAFERYTGAPVESGLGGGWLGSIRASDVARVEHAWNESVRSERPFLAEIPLKRADGSYRWFSAHALPQASPNGVIARWTGTLTDVHDARRAVEERDFLSEASRLLAESLDLQTTLGHVAQLLVPRFADWCQIDLQTTERGLHTAAIAHDDPAKHAEAQQFVGRVHLDPDAENGNAYTIRTGRSQIIEEVRPEMLEAAVGDRAEILTYQMLGTRSVASIPLVAQGLVLGAVGAVFGDSGRRFSQNDLPMLEELGRRAGLAVQNALDFRRQQRVAESFQEASLPVRLPDVHGVEFDAVYSPGSNEAQVGGDWYDAVRLLDGRVVISIGDVAGSGLQAAVRMGNMRQIIRGIAQVHADPSLMLDAADRALRLEHPDDIVTAFVAVLDPVTKMLSYASAGHPPPLLRYADGRVIALSDGGLPLGIRQARDGSSGRTIDVSDMTALVLYTDGLTESFREPLAGETKLIALLADGTLLSQPRPALAIKSAFLDGGAASDDVAILVVGLLEMDVSAEVAPLRTWHFDVTDVASAQRARREFCASLFEQGAGPEDIFSAEMVFGELVGNVVRYARGPVDVSIDLSSVPPVLNVLDRGPGFRHVPILQTDLYSESGRGLFLVSSLTEDFHVSKRPNGGSHARAVLTFLKSRLLT